MKGIYEGRQGALETLFHVHVHHGACAWAQRNVVTIKKINQSAYSGNGWVDSYRIGKDVHQARQMHHR